jgi:hypothetical protein
MKWVNLAQFKVLFRCLKNIREALAEQTLIQSQNLTAVLFALVSRACCGISVFSIIVKY